MAKRSKRSNRYRSPQGETPRDLSFEEEYRYVINDLRRVGILAAVLIGGLIVLSFFI
ncbi:MAG TPA: hypothetical protein PK801_11915 [Aggregatilineales bacterium]|jgi:hypothetical protein|nr:hypothetical protein [Chloroflexota bacterium]HOA25748.1 hypothetical protein [Aggregatilineales bacterium]HPV08077.1 hypothetical protein [Aggregatilineales bacterium]HQA69024.1 hypothetical protein [Aggregatilineales bacterium]